MDAALNDILKQVEELALAGGFTRTGRIETAAIKPRQEIRDACAADKCRSYGKSWSCPPACGSLEECEAQIRRRKSGLILQTVGGMEDSFDYEAIARTAGEHRARLGAFREKLESFFPPPRPYLLLGDGACANCAKCAYPRSPCRAPEKMIVSMEAMGIWVSDLCSKSGIPYYYGPKTLAFTGCLLL